MCSWFIPHVTSRPVDLLFLRRTHFCKKHQDSYRCLENGEIACSSAKRIICLLGRTWLKWGSSCVRQWWPIHHTQSRTVWLSNTSNFAFMAVFQSVFQGGQHHVNAGRAAVTPQESHTQHLEGPKKTSVCTGMMGINAEPGKQWRHPLPSLQTVRAPQRSLNYAFSWCRSWSLSSHIHEEQQQWWSSAVLLSGTTAEVRTSAFPLLLSVHSSCCLCHFQKPTFSLTKSLRPMFSRPAWKYSATFLCLSHEFSRPLELNRIKAKRHSEH